MKKVFCVLLALGIMGAGTNAMAGDEALFVETCGLCYKKGGEFF